MGTILSLALIGACGGGGSVDFADEIVAAPDAAAREAAPDHGSEFCKVVEDLDERSNHIREGEFNPMTDTPEIATRLADTAPEEFKDDLLVVTDYLQRRSELRFNPNQLKQFERDELTPEFRDTVRQLLEAVQARCGVALVLQ